MIKVFNYIEELDCFVVNEKFKEIVDYLGITEWNEVVWIGRYFSLDNDYGEHWFDNWDEREKLEEAAEAMGYKYEFLLVIEPNRFQDGKDGPCHTREERKRFWTDVLKSFHLSLDTIFVEARKFNDELKQRNDGDYLPDLEHRVTNIRDKFSRQLL